MFYWCLFREPWARQVSVSRLRGQRRPAQQHDAACAPLWALPWVSTERQHRGAPGRQGGFLAERAEDLAVWHL